MLSLSLSLFVSVSCFCRIRVRKRDGDDSESEVKQQRNWVGKDGEEWRICRGWQHSERVVGDVVDFGLTDGEK